MLQLETGVAALSLKERTILWWYLIRLRTREYLTADSLLFKKTSAACGLLFGLILLALGRRMQGAGILASIHRANYCETATKMIALFFRRPEGRTTCKRTFVGKIYEEYIERLSPTANTRRFFEEPERILRSRLLVLKSPKPNEKGVIVVDYSFALPILLRFFDVNKIATKYYLVLEPSWSGYCDLDLLCYAKYDFPVFVQAFEPRDAAFIEYTRSNLIAVPTSTNWWVDHRVMKPCPGVSKDVDAIMRYWDGADMLKYNADYLYLQSTAKRQPF